MEQLPVRVGPGGWVRYESDDPPMWVYVRFEARDAEPRPRLIPRDLFVGALDDSAVTADMLRAVPLRSIEAMVNGSTDIGQAIRRRMGHAVENIRQWFRDNVRPGPIAPSPTRRVRLEIPDHRPYGDNFYLAVAELYSQEATRTRAPAVVIADENDVPLRTVQGWILEARKRGFLAPGQPGKAG